MKSPGKSPSKRNMLMFLNPRKLFIMLLCLAFTLYLYATYASGEYITLKLKCVREKTNKKKSEIFKLSSLLAELADQMDKELTSSLIENDTLTVCKENHNDLRHFVNLMLDSLTGSTITTVKSHSDGKLPIIYFVTPTYPRFAYISMKYLKVILFLSLDVNRLQSLHD